ncbi:hypothetical protein ACLKA6_013136 [Drosophila palustris]
MPKKPQHLSIASGNVNNSNTSNKPKYSLTLHNNKYATNGGKQLIPMRDNHQQRQHLKALRLTRDVATTDATDYKRPTLTGLSPAEDVGVHLSRKAANIAGCGAAANGEASIDLTTTKLTGNMTNGNVNGNGNAAATATAAPMANGVVRTQNNRLWYH